MLRERLPRQRFADLALPFEFMKPALNVLVSTGSTAGSWLSQLGVFTSVRIGDDPHGLAGRRTAAAFHRGGGTGRQRIDAEGSVVDDDRSCVLLAV